MSLVLAFRSGIILRLSILLLAALAALLFVTPAFADESHAHGSSAGLGSLNSGPVLWGLFSLVAVLGVLFVSRLALVKGAIQQSHGSEEHLSYFAAVRQLSRNARFFLGYSLLEGLGTGIWTVIFNLYMLRLDFSIGFIGTFWLINMIAHGAASLPVGILADKFGRRQAFFGATALSVIAQAGVLLTQNPSAILLLGAVAGLGQAAHGVAGAPFMMENSEPRERPYLFSLNAGFLNISRFGGNMAGGLLPLAFAAVLGVPNLDPSAARWALAAGLPLIIIATVPLLFIQEKRAPMVGSLMDVLTLRNVVNFPIIARLTLLSLIFGVAFGLTIRFFNIFFEDAHNATDSQIGTLLALGSLAGVGSVFISPLIAQRWGKVPGILITQVMSIPFLLLMAIVPGLSMVAVLFMIRGATYSLAMPLREQLNMEFIAPQERGTTAGFTHTTFDLGGGLGAGLAGWLIGASGYVSTFTVAGALILIPAVFYYIFFSDMEARRRTAAATAAAAAPTASPAPASAPSGAAS